MEFRKAVELEINGKFKMLLNGAEAAETAKKNFTFYCAIFRHDKKPRITQALRTPIREFLVSLKPTSPT
jgi:hypothetical protein